MFQQNIPASEVFISDLKRGHQPFALNPDFYQQDLVVYETLTRQKKVGFIEVEFR